jgi:hypothetical protein
MPLSLPPDMPLDVQRAFIIPIAVSQYIGKLFIVSGLFLNSYDWGKYRRHLRAFYTNIYYKEYLWRERYEMSYA